MSALISKKFKIEIKVVYSTFKVKNYFLLECSTPLPLLSNLVNKFTCAANAHTSYIGYTKRHLIIRVFEPTNSSQAKKSHIFAHINNCTSCKCRHVGVEDFRVLRKCVDETECRIAEALCIKRFRPTINKQLHDQGSSHILRIWK